MNLHERITADVEQSALGYCQSETAAARICKYVAAADEVADLLSNLREAVQWLRAGGVLHARLEADVRTMEAAIAKAAGHE